ncbi:substrate-binding domain-containing protein [Texcoconibacillus texcoconensis]|uniref:Putative molybdopterin biosynthesis protein n=1 Tax=Texcoconibacillus texcoconensis TaxID=1095777 RepID=A0A840QPI4_9BACI|nr:helix-turn-helix transcriptional regulator [Texcoconibacillus texcoconensis]MBB5173280.1 putative molybdopterin biosynthesis protein [Texcoconibacillus texcoconensis]
MNQPIYTPDDIASLLQISKHTVYELIKRGELEAFKVGNKMRIEATAFESYKKRQRIGGQTNQATSENHLILTGSHDLLLEKFIHLASSYSKESLQIQSAFTGSLEGCMSLYRNEANVCSLHWLDESTNTYNVPLVERFFMNEPITVVHFAKRAQGLITTKENPKQIESFSDLTRDDVTFVNRQRGSGTRSLLDTHLAKQGIDPSCISGYDDEEVNHFATATKVKTNEGDVTLGIEAAAKQLDLNFIPLVEEQFDLVIKWNDNSSQKLQALLDTLQNEQLIDVLKTFEGYDLEKSGQILYQTTKTKV